MRILSIETSCDETSIAIMEVSGGIQSASFKVLAHHISSQIDVHIPYGGVYPALAKREHIKNLPVVLEEALRQAKLAKTKIPVDLIAVTYGPGLEPALWTGIVFSQELAKKWGIPIVPVNHMEGHLFSVFGKNTGTFKIPKIKNPTLALLVSGGHTQLVLSKKWMQYEIIGETLDDAVGEAFDKVARMLDLPYPGGPQISRMAEESRAKGKQFLRGVSQTGGARGSAPRARGDSDPAKISFPVALPRPMLKTKDFKFSFSGLKTAVLYLIRDLGGLEKISEDTKAEIALEFEDAAIECLTYKTAKALEKYKAKTLIVAGGVSANAHLGREISKITGKKISLHFPKKELTGDNALMIGIAGYLEFIKNKKKVPKPESIKADGNLSL
ncbi:MAG: tRNA (adenosine(37)-N6)-threonylcarbamoyltransferase complex transferase subunit TsaD [bacterium]|nr:tRNA (adenosine(37)-N6)-threonylcarbamoyltransferase complex transferase subunit TsaD [bacterium]